MQIVDYQPNHLATLVELYNVLMNGVPHCYPIGEAELAGAFAGERGSSTDDELAEDIVLVFVEGDEPIGFVHFGEGYLREGDIESVEAIVRFLAYPRGRRDVGQALLDRAVEWANARQLPAVTAFPQVYRYPHYGFAHAYVSGYLEHVHALFLMNNFEFSGGEVFLDWPDFRPPPLREVPDISFELVTETWESDGPLPNIRVNARQNDENIGECLLWSASRFACTDDVDDFVFCQWLGVNEPFQGKGLGAHLLTAALHEAKRVGYRHACISTAFHNHRALLFYSNCGFRAVDWTRRFRRPLAPPSTRTIPPVLEQGATGDLSALEEYVNPALYDIEIDEAGDAIPFLRGLVEEGGAALDLGCGTGRFTIPLAQAGLDMIGIDISAPMLDHAQRKADVAALSLDWIKSDVRSFQLGRRFSLIFDAGEVFCHVLDRTGHEAILARVREHLSTDGYFVLMVRNVRPADMVNNLQEHEWFSYTDPAGREVRVSGTERYDREHQIYHEDAVRRWRDASGEEVVRYAPLARRYFFAQELETLLTYNGFDVLKRYGDWDESPLTDTSTIMIFVCKLRSSEA